MWLEGSFDIITTRMKLVWMERLRIFRSDLLKTLKAKQSLRIEWTQQDNGAFFKSRIFLVYFLVYDSLSAVVGFIHQI